jgi:hypothetical protein
MRATLGKLLPQRQGTTIQPALLAFQVQLTQHLAAIADGNPLQGNLFPDAAGNPQLPLPPHHATALATPHHLVLGQLLHERAQQLGQ